jgi:hypothetical protein
VKKFKNWLFRTLDRVVRLDVDDLHLKPRNEEFSIYVTHLLKGFKNPYDIRRISYFEGTTTVYFESYSPTRDAFPFDTKKKSCINLITIEADSISVWLKSGAERFNVQSLVAEIESLIAIGTAELKRENRESELAAESWKNMKEFVAKVQSDK